MIKEENKKAIASRICPRCSARLFFRNVLDDRGLTSNDFLELYDIYGHSFIFSKDEFYVLQQKKYLQR